MPITQLLLLKVPVLVLGLIFIGAAVVLSIAGLLTVRYFIPQSKLKAHHDVADPMLGALGAVYAVLLAFVTVTVWQNFDKSNSNVQQEANYLADIYRDAEALSPDFREKVSIVLREYRQAVVAYEWKTMAEGKMSPEVESLMRKIWTLYTNYQPKNLTEQIFFDESVRKLNLFRELRRQRIMDSRTGIYPLLWFVLACGALAVISFTFLFGTENLKAQMVMVILLSTMISLILFTILELDFPFTGTISISPEPFKQVLLD
jgi:hypothetical protein